MLIASKLSSCQQAAMQCQISVMALVRLHETAAWRRTCIRIFVRSSGATEVLPQAPATPPAMSSCSKLAGQLSAPQSATWLLSACSGP